MQFSMDNQSSCGKTEYLKYSVITRLGNRDEQQDSVGFEVKEDEALFVLCDGMGGHVGGKQASSIAVNNSLEMFKTFEHIINPIEFLKSLTIENNNKVFALTDEKGNPLNAGSTQVAVLIQKNAMYWASTGDSRAYLFRDGEFVQLTLDHNYKTVLDEKLRLGMINQEEYNQEIVKGEALISFLGMGQNNLIDYNSSPIMLQKGDRLLAMTDGLYKLVEDETIRKIISNFANINDALEILNGKAEKNAEKNNISRDNMTIILLEIK